MAKHTKRGTNTTVYLKPTAGSDWLLLGGLLKPTTPLGEAEEIETTNHLSPNNTKQYEWGMIDPGEFEWEVQLNLNKSGSAVTGEDPLNALHEALINSVGTNAVWDCRVCLPKVGTAPASFPATPPTDRAYYTGQITVGKVGEMESSVEDIMTTTISGRAYTRFTCVTVV